ncbi:MAG: YesL family protein [Lachnospiraceae bacterium]
MKDAFTLDNPFFRTMGRIGDIFLLNFIFVITSIPVITMGASVTALMTVAVKMTTNREGTVVSGYLKAFKSNFKQATVIHVIMGLLGMILFFDMHFWVLKKAGIMIILSVIPVTIYVMTLLYVYVQQSIFENTIVATIKNALLMSIKNLPVTILLILLMAVVVVGSCISIVADIFMILFGFGLLGYSTAILYRFVYREYLDEPENDELEDIDEELITEAVKTEASDNQARS